MRSTKRTLRNGFLLAILLAAAQASFPSALPFRTGEVLEYDVTYFHFVKGKARLDVVGLTRYRGVRVFHLRQNVDLGSLFKNRIEIWCRQSDLMPLLIRTRMFRNGREALGRQVYHPEKRSATFSLTEEGKTETSTFQRQHPVQDVVTLMYYLRSQALAQGASFPVSLREGEYKLAVTGKDILKARVRGIPGPPLECWVVESAPPKIKAWLTTDEKRLPVRVEVQGGGGFTMNLKGVKGV